jgi:large subunit ribosomal protein L16
MLQPKRVKWRKTHRGNLRGAAHRGNTLLFGEFGLQAQEGVWLTARQIEAARRAITRNVHRGGQLWIRIFPDRAATRKAAETRMGGGKGAPEFWHAAVRPGRILYEISGVGEPAAREALRLASHKLPIKTKILAKE